MNLEFYNNKTQPFFNCRIKSIRDLLLLYNVEIPYEVLFLLSLDNMSQQYSLEVYGIKIPIFTPLSSKADVKLFENIGYWEYREENMKEDDKEEIDNCIFDSYPVIVYFSKPHLHSDKYLGKIAHFSNSLLIFGKYEDGTYQTNLGKNSKVKWELLERARQADLIIESPNHRKIIIYNPKKLGHLLMDIELDKKIAMSILRYCDDYVTNEEKHQDYSKNIKNIMEKILETEDFLIVQRLFALVIQSTIRFSVVSNENLSYGREFFLKAISYYADMVGCNELKKYCTNTKLGLKWKLLGELLLEGMHYTKSRTDIMNFAEKFMERFNDAVVEEVCYIKKLRILLQNYMNGK